MNNQKFEVKNGQIVFRSTGEAIPEDEPVFFLRGIDKTALSLLRVYQASMRPVTKNWKGVQKVIDDFTQFRQENQSRMLLPAEAYSSKSKGES